MKYPNENYTSSHTAGVAMCTPKGPELVEIIDSILEQLNVLSDQRQSLYNGVHRIAHDHSPVPSSPIGSNERQAPETIIDKLRIIHNKLCSENSDLRSIKNHLDSLV